MKFSNGLVREDLKNHKGYYHFKRAEDILNGGDSLFSVGFECALTDFRPHVKRVVESPDLYGAHYSDGKLKLTPVNLDKIDFGVTNWYEPSNWNLPKRYFTHRTTDPDLQVFKSPEDCFTYFAAGNNWIKSSDEDKKKTRHKLFVNAEKLSKHRNIFLDPESLSLDYEHELGKSFMVFGGIPKECLVRLEDIPGEAK